MELWFVSMCFCLTVVFNQASAISGGASVPTVPRVGRKEKLDLPGTVPKTPKTFRSPLGSCQCVLPALQEFGFFYYKVSPLLTNLSSCFALADDCWQADSRDSQGRLVASPASFPSGMKALADYVHSKGLRLGLYSDSGLKNAILKSTCLCCSTPPPDPSLSTDLRRKRTCSGKPGSLGHEAIDALTFAEWGVDYVKYDSCYDDGAPTKRSSALWAYGLADPWRTTLGTDDKWRSVTWVSDANNKWAKYADPRNWNDLDILQVAKGAMSETEHHVQFNLWAIMKAPLLPACALSADSQPAMSILSTDEAIALNQDSLGVQAQEVQLFKESPVKVWVGSLSEGRKVVALVNRGGKSENVTVSWEEIGLNPEQRMHARDLWKVRVSARTMSLHFPASPSHS
ncbi:unnamed protein product [Closterium sp. Naga37s-1]|nr:unnamed protein product [Closterium sp. Naga37s-1]